MSRADVTIYRHANVSTGITLTALLGTTPAIKNDLDENAGFIVTTQGSADTLTLYVSADGTNFYALNDSANSGLTFSISATTACAIPDNAKPFPWIKLVADDVGCIINIVRKA